GDLAGRARAVDGGREVAEPRAELGGRVARQIAELEGADHVACGGLELARREFALARAREVGRRAVTVSRFVKVCRDAVGLLDAALAERALVGDARGRVHFASRLGGKGVDDDLAKERRDEFDRRRAGAPNEGARLEL